MEYLSLFRIISRAILHRLRGSSHPYPANLNAWPNYTLSTNEARLLFYVLPDALTIAALCAIHGLTLWLIIPSAALSFGGICIGQGSYAVNTVVGYFKMTLLMLLRVGAVYAPVASFSHDIRYMLPVLAMILVFPACWISFEPFMQKKLSFKIGKFCVPLVYTIPSSEPEELLIGAIIGLVSALEFLCF